MRPLDPVTPKQRVGYGFAFFVLFVALWGLASFGGYVSKTFLATPLTMLQEGWELLIKHGFLFDIGMTIWRVVGGFVLAAIIAVPLGVLMGSYKPIEAFLEPFVSFARYLPASAFIPLLILWAGIGAVPLGVLMGSYKPIEAFLEPFVSFARYLPASAFIPLLILWAGIGELPKLLRIFIGSVFQIILLVAVDVGNTR